MFAGRSRSTNGNMFAWGLVNGYRILRRDSALCRSSGGQWRLWVDNTRNNQWQFKYCNLSLWMYGGCRRLSNGNMFQWNFWDGHRRMYLCNKLFNG